MTARAFHLIGVGGAGMSVVARLLHDRGMTVTGSDRSDSAVMQELREAGMDVWVGHNRDRVPREAIVVISTAIHSSDPELAYARSRGQHIIHRSQALALAAAGTEFIAVAGTHGKSTTSAMIAVALHEAGDDPSWAVGAKVRGFSSGAHLGNGPHFIAEADESDGSFLNYSPSIEVITNIEADHLDFYGTEQALHQAFNDFVHLLTPAGYAIIGTDSPDARLLAQSVASEHQVMAYGRQKAPQGMKQVQILSEDVHPDSTDARIESPWGEFLLHVPVPGEHNVANAVAAWCVGVIAGVEPGKMARALEAFEGTGRRFEEHGEVRGIRVFDDYAHHPTEIRALIAQARAVATNRVLVLFQPHLFSRTRNFALDFAKALEGADEVVVSDIYPAREDPIPGVTSALITERMTRGRLIPDRFEAGRYLAHIAQAGDVIVTVGAGSVTEVAPVIVRELQEK